LGFVLDAFENEAKARNAFATGDVIVWSAFGTGIGSSTGTEV